MAPMEKSAMPHTILCMQWAQSNSLLGKLEGIGPGSPAAAGRRQFADEQERRWRRERQAIVLSERQGQNNVRRGFAKL